jgi:hypothetical protein
MLRNASIALPDNKRIALNGSGFSSPLPETCLFHPDPSIPEQKKGIMQEYLR